MGSSGILASELIDGNLLPVGTFFSPPPPPLHLQGFTACARLCFDAWPLGTDLPLGWPVTGRFFPEEAPGITGNHLKGHNGRGLPEDTMGLGLHPAPMSHVPLCTVPAAQPMAALISGKETP